MTTTSPNNSFVEDGILYIVPTLTSDAIGSSAIFDGYTYNVSGCTSSNFEHCSAVSNMTLRKVVNPVQSARITTKYSHSIQYGKVEIRARMPIGDWLWPALWMLPVGNEYGPWPISGEIDIVEGRGNGPSVGQWKKKTQVVYREPYAKAHCQEKQRNNHIFFQNRFPLSAQYLRSVF